ncbi:MAG: hypothetical protein MJ246_04430 [Clostridia bacterium]|nr:hypothetical protein [Clostridia bacterium]
MISNKIYFSFYGTYLNFYHIFSGSGAGIVATAAKGKLTSFAEIISLLINVLNLIAFNKSKFRFKKLRYSFLPLIVIYLLTTVIVKSYNYEVISFLAVKS